MSPIYIIPQNLKSKNSFKIWYFILIDISLFNREFLQKKLTIFKMSDTYVLHGAVLLEKLPGLQLVKKIPAFHGTRKFITALKSVRHLSLSCASPIQSIYPHSHLLEIRPNIIHPSTPRSPQWSPSLRFPQQDHIHPTSLHPHAPHAQPISLTWVTATHFNYICILVLTTLRMATGVAETCWWTLRNKIKSIKSGSFVGLFIYFTPIIIFLHLHVIIFET